MVASVSSASAPAVQQAPPPLHAQTRGPMPASRAAPAPSAAVPPLPAPSAHESASAHGDDPLRQALAKARAFLSEAPPAPTAAKSSQPSALESQMQHAALDAAQGLSRRAYSAQNGGRSRPQPVAHAHGAPFESAGAINSQGASQKVLEVCRPLAALVEGALSVGACSTSADIFCFACWRAGGARFTGPDAANGC